MKSKSHSHVGYLIASILFIGVGIWLSVGHLVSDKNEQSSKAHDENEPSRMVDAGTMDAGAEDTAKLPETISKAEESDENIDGNDTSATPDKTPPPLTNADILGELRKNLSGFKKCIRDQKKAGASVEGRLVVTFTINPSGRVTDVQISTAQFKDTHIGKCISGIIAQLKFPEFSGEPKKVSFPFAVY